MAKIKIDIERQIGKVDKLIYGSNVVQLGRCTYGGIWDEKQNTFNKEVINAVKQQGVSMLRGPDANLASSYKWEEGIKEKGSRKRINKRLWTNINSEEFGTNEFIEFCRLVNAEPYIVLNMCDGSLEEAQSWIEYCNSNEDLFYPNKRKDFGYNDPFKVKYWGLGNEVYGKWNIGYLNKEEYIKKVYDFCKILKGVDQSIKLIASGYMIDRANLLLWDAPILEALYDQIDFIGLHIYLDNIENDYYKYMSKAVVIEEIIKVTKNNIENIKLVKNKKRDVYINIDEWNVFYRAITPEVAEFLFKDNYNVKLSKDAFSLEEEYNLEDALIIGMFLNSFIRNADIVKMANMAQLVNVVGPIFTSKNDILLQSIFYPFSLYASQNGDISIDSFIDCESFSVDGEDFPILDISTTFDSKTKKIVLNVINKHLTQDISTEIINLSGNILRDYKVYEINSENIKDTNTIKKKDKIKIIENNFSNGSNKFKFIFPFHSISSIVLQLQ